MSRKSTFFAAILFVAIIGTASAMDYSAAMNPNGKLGFEKPVGVQLGTGPANIIFAEDAITNAVSADETGFVISNFRNVPAGAMKNLAGIEPVSEPTGG